MTNKTTNQPMLKIDNLHVYYGAIHAIKGISLEVNQGEIVTLIWANGAGKSTTLRTISGLLKERGCGKIFICSTFGLFSGGLQKFDEAHQKGIFDKLLTTNMVYQSPELLSKEYYISCDMSKYIALIIDTLNHDLSISDLLNPVDRITRCVENYKKKNA